MVSVLIVIYLVIGAGIFRGIRDAGKERFESRTASRNFTSFLFCSLLWPLIFIYAFTGGLIKTLMEIGKK